MPVPPPRRPGHPPTFADLSALHPLILSYLKELAPRLLLSVCKELYDELLPRVYARVAVDKHTAQALFTGFLPLSNSWQGIRRGSRYSYLDLPLPGRRARSLPPAATAKQPQPGSESSPSPSPSPPLSLSPRNNRKSRALAYTTHLTLQDAESLSIICAAHIELLSYSPISRSAHSHGHGHAHREEHKWPLRNVRTLTVGWPLIRYLADSHSPHPRAKALPICCIPIDATVLVIQLGKLGGVRKRHLRQAISELASEFQLERVEFITLSTAGTTASGEVNKQIDGPGHEEGEIYIPPISTPLPAPSIRLVLGPIKQQAGETEVYCKAIRTWIRDTAGRVNRLPRVEVVLRGGGAKEVERSLKGYFGDVPEVEDEGADREAERRVLDACRFVDL